MSPRRPRAFRRLLALLGAVSSAAAAEPIDFNRQIRPILADACFHCHGPDAAAREAKLRLDERDGLYGVREGVAVVVPGKPEESELLHRIVSPHEGEVIGIVVKVDEDDIYGFSSNMRYVIRKSKAVFQKEDGKQNLALILDGNDSLVRIQKMDFPIREGDFFKIPKKKATESFLNF